MAKLFRLIVHKKKTSKQIKIEVKKFNLNVTQKITNCIGKKETKYKHKHIYNMTLFVLTIYKHKPKLYAI